jgi:hypothetical protein
MQFQIREQQSNVTDLKLTLKQQNTEYIKLQYETKKILR